MAKRKKGSKKAMDSVKRARRDVKVTIGEGVPKTGLKVTWDILTPTPSFPAEKDVLDVVSKAYHLVELCGSVSKAKEVLDMYERLAHA